jgi:hypothetical protein
LVDGTGTSRAAVYRVPQGLRGRTLSEYSGLFYSEELDALWGIRPVGDALTLHRRLAPDMQLEYLFDETFLQSGNVVRFSRDAKGLVTGFTVKTDALPSTHFVLVRWAL